MPLLFTTQNLEDAIVAQNLVQVQAILADRDEHGIPRVDLNHGFNLNHGNAGSSYITGTALMMCLCRNCSHFDEDIFQCILDVRDNLGNIVVEVNQSKSDGSTIIYSILSDAIQAQQSRRLLQRFIDLRMPNGDTAVNLNAHTYSFTLLNAALRRNDIEIFRILLDARNADGTHVLDINEITFGSTILDEALQAIPRNDLIIRTIQEAGGLRIADIPPQVRTAIQERRNQRLALDRGPHPILPRPAIAAPPLVAIINERAVAPQEDREFDEDGQNTHRTEVNVTVSNSVKKLLKRYPNINIAQNIAEVKQYLTNLPNSNSHKAMALACANRIERTEGTHSYTEITLPHVLALIWEGIKDKNALPAEVTEKDAKFLDSYVRIRKESLTEKLYEAQTTYGPLGGAACFTGTFNKVVETLNHADKDVTVVTTQNAVKPTANEMALSIIYSELRKKPVREHKQILREWFEDDSQCARAFRDAMATLVDAKLKEAFGEVILQVKDRQGIAASINDLPRPIVHVQLSELEKTIYDLFEEQADSPRIKVIAELKAQSKHIYDDNDLTLQQEYEILQSSYKDFKKLDELFNSINVLSDDNNNLRNEAITVLKDQVKQIYLAEESFSERFNRIQLLKNDFDKLDKLVLQINSLSDDYNNNQRNAALFKLKDKICGIYTGTNSFSEKFNQIQLEKNSFDKLDEAVNHVLKISKLYKGPRSTTEIAIAVKDTYFSYSFFQNIPHAEHKLLSYMKNMRYLTYKNHKEHGALRFFGRFQPQSRLVKQFDKAIKDIESAQKLRSH